MAIEIVDFPIKNGDFPLQTVSSPEGMQRIDILERWRSGVHTNHLETKTGISLYVESDACQI